MPTVQGKAAATETAMRIPVHVGHRNADVVDRIGQLSSPLCLCILPCAWHLPGIKLTRDPFVMVALAPMEVALSAVRFWTWCLLTYLYCLPAASDSITVVYTRPFLGFQLLFQPCLLLDPPVLFLLCFSIRLPA